MGAAVPGRKLLSHVLGELPQLEFLNFPSRGFGQLGEHDIARAFEAREIAPAPRDELFCSRLAPRLELDEGARRLAPFLIWLCHDRGGLHGWMLVERVLDLDRGDVLA